MPVFDSELKKIDKTQTREEIYTEDEFLQWLYETNDRYIPDMPAFEFISGLLKTQNPEICLTSFVDAELGEFVDLESACTTYHCLPYEGALLDQPQRVLDIFSIIRTEKNRYEKVRADKLLAKTRSQNSMDDVGKNRKRPLHSKRPGRR